MIVGYIFGNFLEQPTLVSLGLAYNQKLVMFFGPLTDPQKVAPFRKGKLISQTA